ncbi:hypothetical protein Ahy_A05g025686 [Arachis hypogaea]|uniref:Replication factor A C-terminal domain-containing protein n=1 Tax=Arachis hypogaea TaxID=3818 RepID=A0A445D979_ARAHY|nr:hypothetical protein Ahy_A05g025686 [Arachis hypogaea]
MDTLLLPQNTSHPCGESILFIENLSFQIYTRFSEGYKLDDYENFDKYMLLSVSPSSSVRISQVSSQHTWSGADEFNQGYVSVKTIEETLGLVQEGPCWISATIVAINAMNKDWFYKACRRFKVEVMVYDGTRSMSLLLWDRETTQLCGKRAEQVMEENLQITGGDKYPPILDNMIDKKVLFKINVKYANINHRDQVYTIIKMCDDDEIIQKNLPKEMQSNQSISVMEINCSNL